MDLACCDVLLPAVRSCQGLKVTQLLIFKLVPIFLCHGQRCIVELVTHS